MSTPTPSLAPYTPAQTLELLSRSGAKRGKSRPDKTFFAAMSAGCFVALGGGASLMIATIPWFNQNAPGLVKMFFGLTFPMALVMIIFTNGELFTGSTMITGIAFLQRRLSVWYMLRHWFICFWGNFVGCVFTMAIFMGSDGGAFDNDPYRSQVISFVTAKQVTPQWHQIFIRAIGANWLVCLAIYMGCQGREILSRVALMYIPVFFFVMIGFDHVVANMFFIPMGIWLGTPGVTIGLYIWKGIIPALLGNTVGGFVFCACYFYYQFIWGEEPIAIDGVYYQEQARMEEGNLGPSMLHPARSGSDGQLSGNTAKVDVKQVV
ncbi:Formate/nitrite transporter-domain-containing protein [Cercophora newfieldiana]|uniref:Formate/nitrite transporter-domain-containing protein n=1 Tax=Cercophora newfieldiana TaxID=92897 RepID=A0AA39YTA0_9PEZI|nr:Formate/nitrite transporter-domain-containing protein [Cercophora newfieldiana]